MMGGVGAHFDQQHERYLESVFKSNRQFYLNINRRLYRFLHGVMADIGNGGVFTYDVSRLDRIFAVDISFRNISRLKRYPNVKYIREDARKLRSIREGSCDVVLLQFVLHHITGKTRKGTLKNVGQVLKESHRVLKQGGTLIVIESTTPRILEFAESVMYQVSRFLLWVFRKPMIFFFSRKTLLGMMKDAGFRRPLMERVDFGKKIDLANGLMPGLLIVPSWLAPHRCTFFKATK